MRRPFPWNGDRNQYVVSSGDPASPDIELSVYAEPPHGPRRRIRVRLDDVHATALAEALRRQVAGKTR